MLDLMNLFNQYRMIVKKIVITGALGYQPGYEAYLETICFFGIFGLFLYGMWIVATTHILGPLGIWFAGSDETKTISLKKTFLTIFALFALHASINTYQATLQVPAGINAAKHQELDVKTTNEIAEIAHHHGVNITKAISTNIHDMGIHAVGTKNGAKLYISDSWLESDERHSHFLVLLEQKIIELKNYSFLKKNILESGLFGVSAMLLAHLYLVPLTTTIAANFILWNGAFIATRAYGNYVNDAFSRSQTYRNDQETAQSVGIETLQNTLRFFDSEIKYDQTANNFPYWKLSIPQFSARLARLRANNN